MLGKNSKTNHKKYKNIHPILLAKKKYITNLALKLILRYHFTFLDSF